MLTLYTKLQTMKQSLQDETGASAVEYGLLVALIAVAIITAVTALGGGLEDTFEQVACAVNLGDEDPSDITCS